MKENLICIIVLLILPLFFALRLTGLIKTSKVKYIEHLDDMLRSYTSKNNKKTNEAAFESAKQYAYIQCRRQGISKKKILKLLNNKSINNTYIKKFDAGRELQEKIKQYKEEYDGLAKKIQGEKNMRKLNYQKGTKDYKIINAITVIGSVIVILIESCRFFCK